MSGPFFCPPVASLTGNPSPYVRTAIDGVVPALPPAIDVRAATYRGLIGMHASEIASSPTFRAKGQPTTEQVHAIAKDLRELGRLLELDQTVSLILARADALTLKDSA